MYVIKTPSPLVNALQEFKLCERLVNYTEVHALIEIEDCIHSVKTKQNQSKQESGTSLGENNVC